MAKSFSHVILTDEEAFKAIKEGVTRERYVKTWKNFCDFLSNVDFEAGPPTEEEVIGPLPRRSTED